MKMKNRKLIFLLLTLLSAFLMSLPWLVPHMGWTALMGLVPLLVMERLASQYSVKHFWWWHYGTFVLWNAATTWWIWNATPAGGVFAILANALQMSVVFGSFRWVKRRMGGALPYIYLVAAWIAWERWYLTWAQISWPWLVLGNAFADTTALVQWYSVLGTLGGSLWVWVANLSIFGLMVALSDGRMARWTAAARAGVFVAAPLAFFGPMLWSACLHPQREGEPLKVVIGQPNYDPYEKRGAVPREQQDRSYLSLVGGAQWEAEKPTLVLAPETFILGMDKGMVGSHESFGRFQRFLREHPQASLIFGAGNYEYVFARKAPDLCAYDRGSLPDGTHCWMLMHNSAIATDTTGRADFYHKSKLVVATELTPYPRLFIPLQKWLLGGTMMGQDIGQEKIACLKVCGGIPVGVPICYESVYGEFCTGYVREGAQLLAVITNDAWWGDSPGHLQHLNYSRLRAIECGRWVARCGNTGISAFIDPAGRILDRTAWWQPAMLEGSVSLLQGQTFFVRWGDIVGRVGILLWGLLAAAAIFRPQKKARR